MTAIGVVARGLPGRRRRPALRTLPGRIVIAPSPPSPPSPAAPPPEKTPHLVGSDGAGTTLTAAFLHAVGQEMGQGSLTGDALARAAAGLLPVDGAGITVLVEDLRLPLGASSDAMRRAEEVQTSLGDGPCVSAAQSRTALVADLPDLLRRWPLYAREILRRTPYRSAAAVPLRDADGRIFAALDLASESPQLSRRLDLHDVDHEVGTPLGALLEMCMHPVRGADGLEVLPAWYEHATARRQEVWVAVGMVLGHLHQPGSEALSLLRGYAYSHDLSLDDVAAAVVRRDLRVRDIMD